MELKNLGSFLVIDAEGYFVPIGDRASISGIRKEALGHTINGYQKTFGEENIHSIWVRGSVAKGQAIEGLSDIDTICVTHEETSPQEQGFTKIRKEISKKYEGVAGIDLSCIGLERLGRTERWLFMLTTQSVCIFGNGDEIIIGRKYKPNKKLAEAIIEKKLGEHIVWVKKNIPDSSKKKKQRCTRIMKRVLRGGGVLVMEQSKKFSRDLYPCREIFSIYYPDKKDEMYKALDRAVNPIDDYSVIIEYLESFGVWLDTEIRAYLG